MIAGKKYGKNYIQISERWCKDIGKSKEQGKTRWSYSRVTCFCNCKYEYYLKYILKDFEIYPSEWNYYAEVGSFVHEILAKIFNGELELDDSAQYFVENYDDTICYKVRQSTMDKTFGVIAEYFSDVDMDWLKNYKIMGVELQTEFKLDKYDFVGFIDLLLRDKSDGKIVIIDHKSFPYPFKNDGSVKKAAIHNYETYKRQMYLYAHAVKQIYNEFPKEMVWNCFKDGGKLATIPFDMADYEETMEWFRNKLIEIEQEEDYEPTEEFFYCTNLCNFRGSCEYANLTRKELGD